MLAKNASFVPFLAPFLGVVDGSRHWSLRALLGSRDRGESDRARAALLTLAGWTSPRIAEAFGGRDDTVRSWRSEFGRGGADALKAKPGAYTRLLAVEDTNSMSHLGFRQHRRSRLADD